MICFQISIFELLETTNPFRIIHKSQLWFAFKSVYLNYWKQLELIIDDILHGCDLLSNQYIWTTGNNFWYDWLLVLPVVICFQISIFELLETTLAEDTEYEEVVVICFQISIFELLETTWTHHRWHPSRLWFAFKSVYLNYWKQLLVRLAFGATGCDLLSNQYIWTTGNNFSWRYRVWRGSCDLLSNQYIWTTGNNARGWMPTVLMVVICFQISIFELLETTSAISSRHRIQLWFAFKSVYLNYWKQLKYDIKDLEASCDLLSNQYIWTTGNNHSLS